MQVLRDLLGSDPLIQTQPIQSSELVPCIAVGFTPRNALTLSAVNTLQESLANFDWTSFFIQTFSQGGAAAEYTYDSTILEITPMSIFIVFVDFQARNAFNRRIFQDTSQLSFLQKRMQELLEDFLVLVQPSSVPLVSTFLSAFSTTGDILFQWGLQISQNIRIANNLRELQPNFLPSMSGASILAELN